MQERLDLGADSLIWGRPSNHRYPLQHAVALGIPVLGIEPAGNIAEIANEKGIRTESYFLGEATGADAAARYGKADLVVGNNVFAHVPDIVDFAKGLRALVKDDGLVSLEFPHLLQLIENRQYDTIYHEHYSYLTLKTAALALDKAGLKVVDVQELASHGGSLRVMSTPTETAGEPSDLVKKVLQDEQD